MQYDPKLCGTSCHGSWITAAGEPGLVSVIIPTFNRAAFLIQAMDSVLAQAYRPIEMIVVDDGSTDDTQAVIKKWSSEAREDPGFTLVYAHQSNRGATVARNLGIIKSHGQYIQFLDSDDVLLPEKIGRGVQFLSGSKADYWYCTVSFVDEKLNPLKGHLGSPGKGTDGDIVSYLWQSMGPLFRRELIARTGPWLESVFDGDDWEYAARVKLFGFVGHFDPTPGGLLRIHETDRERTPVREIRGLEQTATCYDRIVNISTRMGRLSPVVRSRMARRYFMTAVQFGCHGLGARRRLYLEKALDINDRFNAVRFLAWFLRAVNSRTAYSLLQRLLFAKLGIKAIAPSPRGGLRHCAKLCWEWFRTARAWILVELAHLLSRGVEVNESSCMVLAPHPDDETFATGGLIAQKRRFGAEVRVLFLTGGEASHLQCKCAAPDKIRLARERQAMAALSFLGVNPDKVSWLKLPDGTVPAEGEAGFDEVVRKILMQLNRWRPGELGPPQLTGFT